VKMVIGESSHKKSPTVVGSRNGRGRIIVNWLTVLVHGPHPILFLIMHIFTLKM